MASRSDGVQQLLMAERAAAEKVSEARKRKARYVKQAKEEASAEIETYRKEREMQYKQLELKMLGSHGDRQAKIDEQTAVQLVQLSEGVEGNKEAAIQRLLTLVCNIEPELHVNYQS